MFKKVFKGSEKGVKGTNVSDIEKWQLVVMSLSLLFHSSFTTLINFYLNTFCENSIK